MHLGHTQVSELSSGETSQVELELVSIDPTATLVPVKVRVRLGANISDEEQQARYQARDQLVTAFEHDFTELQADDGDNGEQ